MLVVAHRAFGYPEVDSALVTISPTATPRSLIQHLSDSRSAPGHITLPNPTLPGTTVPPSRRICPSTACPSPL